MGTNTLTGQNIEFPIYKADGSSFYGLVLRKATFDSVVMSLGDKITGDVVYKDNTLPVSMNEYIELCGVKYTLVNPPTVVREGFAKDNSDLKGMTRYSFEFYHPMYQLGNLPFSDVAVSSDEQRYLSENKVFNWIGKPDDYIAKLNKNLENTQWVVVKSVYFPTEKLDVLSEVLSFDKATIADALKTWYDTWKVPFIVDAIKETDPLYAQGKRFSIIVGFPAEEILDSNGNPYIFKMGQGVGLKNNSRTPKNNKIVTRIAPYGSERNIPYGYPQIVWTGNQDWEYTINNDPTAANSYPIYDGIVGGQNVRLIKHPFTRKTLMPSIYATLVNKKVNPNATGYDPTIELVDYYDATSEEGYPNPINQLAPSYEAHEFGDIYPRLDEKSILGAEPYDTLEEQGVDGYLNETAFLGTVLNNSTSTKNSQERTALLGLYNALNSGSATYHAESQSGDDYQFVCDVTSDADFYYVKYTSSNINYDVILLKTGHSVPVATSWNDKMDDDGNYIQSYFKIALPVLNFDMYACASITEEMKISMRSGACIGCTFNVAVDWDDYKRNFYDENGNFAPNGSQRDLAKYPKTNDGSVTLIVQKDNETFGTLMPNIYQQPKSGDKFVVLGISLPTSYIADAEQELDEAAKQYMLENNVYYYEYPLKFDEYFLAKNTYILNQIKPNSIVRFKYNGEQDNIVLYVKQITIKYGQGVLPQYDITITDDIEVVLNKIGQVTDDVSRLRLDLSQLMQYYNGDTSALEGLQLLLADKLSKVSDDTAQGFIKFLQGLQVGERFVSGILGEGGVFRRNADGKVYLETDNLYVRMKAYFDTIEVRHYKHSSGNRIASNAGIHCSRVSWIDASGNHTEDIDSAVKFRCFFRATDGDDTVENYFMAASDGTQDLAFCDKTSLSSGISKRRYWRAVVGKNSVLTDDGEAWIDLSKSDCESGSDIPMAGDDIIQLGNRTDSERQGAIIEYVNGNDAPSYHIYQYINSFDLSGKNIIRIGFNSRTGRAEMNVYGDAYIGDPNGSTYVKYNQATKKVEIKAEVSIQSTFGGQTFEEKVAECAPEYDDSWIQPAIDELQNQIDGAIETYYMVGEPDINLPPVVSTQQHPYDDPWLDGTETPSERTKILNNHVGDLYYDKATGYGYRFLYDDDTHSFGWARLADVDIEAALEAAANAQATADGKMTIYSVWGAWVKNGVNTLQVGDLFIPVNDITPTQGGATYKARKVYKCTTTGQNSFVEIHYTDDSALINFINNTYSSDKTNILQQIDSKAETWYQPSNPANNWSEAEKPSHKGDIWHNTSNTTIGGVGAGLDAIWSGSEWVVSDVPQSVYDKIDGKATIYGNASSNPPTGYHKNDLWILATDYGTTYKAGTILSAQNDYVNSFSWNDWKEDVKYTKDLKDFIDNTYSTDITNLESQIDGKAETWWQNNNPADSWTDNTTKAKHVGDLWMDTSSNGGNKTYIYVDKGAGANPRYMWEEQNVPTEVFNKINGKAQIFVTRPTPPYNVGDLWVQGKNGEILKCTTTRTSGSYSDDDWTWASKYTDDSKFNGYINQVLNGTGATGDTATVANAIRVIKGALNEATIIDGGLVLTSLINLRSNNKTWAGISGQYNASAQGGGIAAWYGGTMVDHEVNTTASDYAKSLFRFDGSGYLASGGISWNSGNNLKINLKSDSTSGIPSFKMLSGNSNESLVLEESQSSGNFVKWYGLAASSKILNYAGDFLTVGVNVRSNNTGRAKIVLCDTTISSNNVSIAPNVSILTPDFLAFRYREHGAAETIGTLATIGIYNTGTYAGYIDLRAQYWLRRAIKNDGNFDSGTAYVDTYGYLRVKDFGDTDEGNPSGGTTGSVTSVGLSAPTGFQVSNSPIRTSGTIALSFASGYSLPTTAKQTNWDTAYGWGNHANAGYITSSGFGNFFESYCHDNYVNISLFYNNVNYATQSWVQQQGYITSYTDTKNTAGSTNDDTNKLYLVGSKSQSSYAQTYSSQYVYVNNGVLYAVKPKGGIVLGGQCGIWDDGQDDLLIDSSNSITLNADVVNVSSALHLSNNLSFVDDAFYSISFPNHSGYNYNAMIEEDSECHINIWSPKGMSIDTNGNGLSINGNLTVNSTLTTRNGNLNVWSPQNYTLLPRCLFIIENIEWARLEMDTSAAFHFKHGSTDNTYSRIYAASFNQASDLRKKTIAGNVSMNLYNVANAPLFKFTWNDGTDNDMHIGSAAQYWQTILPELVIQGSDADMALAMQYDVIALASVITVAKTVVSHEERIKILENENKALKEEIELLKNKS